jgi:hypothetical protein
MRVKLLGLQNFSNLVIQKTGEVIDGVKIYYSYVDGNTCGEQAAGAFFKRQVYDSFGIKLEDLVDTIGEYVKLEYNRYGKASFVELIPANYVSSKESLVIL